MLEQPEVVDETDRPQSEEKPQTEEKLPTEEKPAVAPVVEAHGYSRIGPGPVAALRFKWAVREEHADWQLSICIGCCPA